MLQAHIIRFRLRSDRSIPVPAIPRTLSVRFDIATTPHASTEGFDAFFVPSYLGDCVVELHSLAAGTEYLCVHDVADAGNHDGAHDDDDEVEGLLGASYYFLA